METPTLMIMIGAPGTGKTFIATRLAERLGATLVQTDAIRKRLFRNPVYSKLESARVYREAHRDIGASLRSGLAVVFDATNLREAARRSLYRIAEAAGADLLLIWLWSPEAIIAKRLTQRQIAPDPSDLSDATWPVYRQLAATAQPPKRAFILLNSTATAEELLRVLCRALGPRFCG